MSSQESNRSLLIKKNILVSFVVKGWSAVVVLLMVPLTLKMLGIYNNGVWLTISGILMWVDLFDIGLGNGLRNSVANDVAKGDVIGVRKAISSTFFMLMIIIVPLLLVMYAIIYMLDMYSALGVSASRLSNLDNILAVAVTIGCSTFILKSVGNFYMGIQLPAMNNLIICAGQTLALFATFIAYKLGSTSLMTVVAINTLAPFVVWLMSVPYTFCLIYPQYKPSVKYVNLRMARSLCSTGLKFFVIQICGVILLTSTNIIISKIFSPAEVTPYQVAYRYFSLVLVVFTIICMPFWNATTDAYVRGDIEWIQRASKKLDRIVILVFVALLLMTLCSDFVYRLWVGEEVHIPLELTASVAVYIFILVVSLRYSYLLNGVGALKIQLVFTIMATVIFLPLALLICKRFGTVTSLVCTMCIVNLPGLLANAWKYNRIFFKNNAD